MKKRLLILIFVLLLLFVVSCSNDDHNNNDENPLNSLTTIEEKVNWWINNLSLDEKIGQMIQAERLNNGVGASQSDVKNYNLGSILNGGGNTPKVNNAANWKALYESYQSQALNSSSKIPIIYGIDAVHGHNNLFGATIFPHNIGLAAANNPDLMEKIGEATAYEIAQTGLNYNFSPSIGIVKDKRWGRTYETFGEDPAVAKNLIGPYIKGLQKYNIAGSAKHFIGDGYTIYGTGLDGKVDRGNAIISDIELNEIHLPLYQEAIKAGIKTIMMSYSSLNGIPMHQNKEMIDKLKNEMGFKGFVIADYNGIDMINKSSLREKTIEAANAGIDMYMNPHNFIDIISHLKYGVNNNLIKMSRIDDAVKRILTVKYEIGLFEEKEKIPFDLRNNKNLEIARQAVRESLVLLKNENEALPLKKSEKILLVGPGSNNIGIQSGGWTISWQGSDNINIPGTTIYEAFKEVSGSNIYTNIEDIDEVDKIILVLAEKPHAEMLGDSTSLSLISDTSYSENLEWINLLKDSEKPIITILISSKPLLINDYIDYFDSFVMAFLPGTEGQGVADVLYGDYDFKGILPYTYPKNVSQADQTFLMENYNYSDYQFPYGFGLKYIEREREE